VGHRVIFDVFLAGITKENATIALDQSALSDLLDSIRSGEDLDFMRSAMELAVRKLRQGSFLPSLLETPPHRPGVVGGDHGGRRAAGPIGRR